MHWLPIDKLDRYKAYPLFFREKLLNLKNEVYYHKRVLGRRVYET